MLNKSHLIKSKVELKHDWQIIIAVVLLCAGGLTFLASSLNTSPDNYWQELGKQVGIGLGVGSIACIFLAKTDYHLWLKYKNWLAGITVGLLVFVGLFAIPVYFISGIEAKQNFVNRFSSLPIAPYRANGATRWINLPAGLPNVQPSEIAKITLLIFVAGTLGKYYKKGYSWQILKKMLWLLGGVATLIILQPDLGNVVVIFIIITSAMLVAKVPKQIIWRIILVCLILGILSIVATPYRLARFSIYGNLFGTSEKSDSNENRQQVVNIQYAMQNGGLWGKGYGNSEWKQAGQIYEASTDSIIAVIGEEMGFVGTIAFLMLYAWLFWRGQRVADNAKDIEGQMIATGISVWIATQVVLNVCGMTGLIPMKGLPLPFVSQGGTALVLNLVGIGILLNISSQSKTRTDKRFAL